MERPKLMGVAEEKCDSHAILLGIDLHRKEGRSKHIIFNGMTDS